MLLSSFGAVQSNFEVAQGTGEVGPCSQNQMGTFLEHRRQTEKDKIEFQGQMRLQSLWAISYTAKTKYKQDKQDKKQYTRSTYEDI